MTTWNRILCLAPFVAALLGGFAPRPADAQDAAKMKFEVYADKAGEFRWRLKAKNGETLATAGQGYKAKADAKHGVELVQKSGAAGSKLTYEVYEDAKKEQRWRLKSANGQVVASSSEGYKAKADAEKAITLVKEGAGNAEVLDAKE